MGLFGGIGKALGGLAKGVFGTVTEPFKGSAYKDDAKKNQQSALDQYMGLTPGALPGVAIERITPGTVAGQRAKAGQAAYARQARAGQGTYAGDVRARQSGYVGDVNAQRSGYVGDVRARQGQYSGDVRAQQVRANLIGADNVYAPALDERDMLESEFQNYYEDPRMRNHLVSALDQYGQMQREGFTAEDKAALYGIQKDQERAVRAQRQGIEQQMLNRGTYGSGMQLALQLQGAQDQNELAAQQGMDVAAMSLQSKRNALDKGAQLAGSIRDQDFGQFAERAHALDDMGRFNEESAQRYEMANADFDLRSQLANQDAQLRARLANQSATLSAAQGNQGANLQAGMANQSQRNDMSQFNAGQGNMVAMGNQQTNQQNRQFNAGQQNTVAMNNQGVQQQNRQFNTGQYNTVAMNNQGQRNDMSMFNAGQRTQTGIANMNMVAGTNQFNAGQRTQTSMHNSDMSLRESMTNIENQMKSSMFNSTAGEREQMYAREAQQWQWAQNLGLADRKAGVYMGNSQLNMMMAEQSNGQLNKLLSGAMMMFGGGM